MPTTTTEPVPTEAMSTPNVPTLRVSLILGLLAAVGPFAIDMYLPAMPGIASALGTNATSVQRTLIAYFVAFGLAQLAYGPWSDRAGRRTPLVAGLAIFVLGSIGCALAPTIGWLIACRALQGLGGAALLVVPRAVIRDLHTGAEATRLMATVMLVISVFPMLAPLAGTGLLALGDWRLIFWGLALAAVLALMLTLIMLPETLPSARRSRIDLDGLRRDGVILLRDPVFIGLTLIGGFGFGGFMVFIVSAAFVYAGQFGLSPLELSLAFAVNTIGFVAFGFRLLLLAWTGLATLPVIVAGLFCAFACLAPVIPTTMVMALDAHGPIAGLASSLGGTIQMLTGGAMVALLAPFLDGTATPTVAGIALCAALTLAVLVPTLRAMARTADGASPAAAPAGSTWHTGAPSPATGLGSVAELPRTLLKHQRSLP